MLLIPLQQMQIWSIDLQDGMIPKPQPVRPVALLLQSIVSLDSITPQTCAN